MIADANCILLGRYSVVVTAAEYLTKRSLVTTTGRNGTLYLYITPFTTQSSKKF